MIFKVTSDALDEFVIADSAEKAVEKFSKARGIEFDSVIVDCNLFCLYDLDSQGFREPISTGTIHRFEPRGRDFGAAITAYQEIPTRLKYQAAFDGAKKFNFPTKHAKGPENNPIWNDPDYSWLPIESSADGNALGDRFLLLAEPSGAMFDVHDWRRLDDDFVLFFYSDNRSAPPEYTVCILWSPFEFQYDGLGKPGTFPVGCIG